MKWGLGGASLHEFTFALGKVTRAIEVPNGYNGIFRN